MSAEVVSLLVFAVYISICAVFRIGPKAAKAAIVAGLVMLVAGAVCFNTGKEAIANQLAMYSFGLLGSGVALLFIQYIRESRYGGHHDEGNEEN